MLLQTILVFLFFTIKSNHWSLMSQELHRFTSGFPHRIKWKCTQFFLHKTEVWLAVTKIDSAVYSTLPLQCKQEFPSKNYTNLQINSMCRHSTNETYHITAKQKGRHMTLKILDMPRKIPSEYQVLLFQWELERYIEEMGFVCKDNCRLFGAAFLRPDHIFHVSRSTKANCMHYSVCFYMYILCVVCTEFWKSAFNV